MTQKELKQGENFEFADSEGYHHAEVSYRESWNIWYFRVYFNGVFVHMSKTYKPCERKMKQLIEDFNLVEIPNVEGQEEMDFWDRRNHIGLMGEMDNQSPLDSGEHQSY